MSIVYDQFYAAFADAKATVQRADLIAGQLAEILTGRLRRVPGGTLAELKRELADFNLKTYRWKKRR